MSRYVPAVRRFADYAMRFHSAVADAVGLHVTDVRGLRLLAEAPRTAGELAAELHLTSAAVTALIDRLERHGYVMRQRTNPDRRLVTVHAVPDRVRAVDNQYQSQGKAMAKLLATYTEEEFTAIVDFLERCADTLVEEIERIQMCPHEHTYHDASTPTATATAVHPSPVHR